MSADSVDTRDRKCIPLQPSKGRKAKGKYRVSFPVLDVICDLRSHHGAVHQARSATHRQSGCPAASSISARLSNVDQIRMQVWQEVFGER